MIEEFHRKRVPFIVLPNNFVLARLDGTSLSHEGWANEACLPNSWITWLRGFYWKETNEIFFYTSAYTRNYVGVAFQFYTNLNRIFNRVGANRETLIHGGMIPGEPGTLWQPVKTYGRKEHFTLGEFDGFHCRRPDDQSDHHLLQKNRGSDSRI